MLLVVLISSFMIISIIVSY